NQRLRDTNLKLRSFEGQILDKTTKLYSREYFTECMSTEFLKAKKEVVGLSFVVAKCSVSGDNVYLEQLLGEIGRVFGLHQRPTDLSARLGSAKAVVMLCEANRDGAGAFLRRVRRDIDKFIVEFRESRGSEADVSFFTFVYPEDSQEREAMIALLDQC
ncbi:hypothetical protein KBA41_15345, partial [Candidatus Ozemobacteraceae bacterium]|nr:hypothetical protein [Candidatus Ozemobacteraceae bacterium]